MSYRAFLVNAAAKAKRMGLADLAFRYNPVVRFKVSRAIEQFRRAGLSERRDLSQRMTARTIAAARASAYGRGFGERYEDWPLLTKTTLRDAASTVVLPALLRIPATTGGTTGTPLLLQRSAESAAAEQTFLDGLLGPGGPAWGSSRIAVLRGDAVKDPQNTQPPFGIETHFGRRLVLSAVHLKAETFPWYLDALRRFRPRILLAYPNQAINLLHLLEKTRQHIQLDAIVTSSEQLMPDVRTALEDGLGAPVHDFYGQAERVCFASSCEAETYYFEPAYGRVELLPAAWHDAGPGRRAVSIVGTSFWNHAMPLVRYDTGDLAIVPDTTTPEELERIALGLLPFLGIAGRSGEFVLSPEGVRITALGQIPREVDRLLQVQVIQEPCGLVIVQALIRPGFGEADRAKLLANIRAKIPSAMSFRLDLVERLATTAGGKTPFVIRRSAAMTHNRP